MGFFVRQPRGWAELKHDARLRGVNLADLRRHSVNTHKTPCTKICTIRTSHRQNNASRQKCPKQPSVLSHSGGSGMTV